MCLARDGRRDIEADSTSPTALYNRIWGEGPAGLQGPCSAYVQLRERGHRKFNAMLRSSLATQNVLTTGVNSWELRVLAHAKISDGLVNEAVTHKFGTFLEGSCRFDEACLARRRKHRCSGMIQVSRWSNLSERCERWETGKEQRSMRCKTKNLCYDQGPKLTTRVTLRTHPLNAAHGDPENTRCTPWTHAHGGPKASALSHETHQGFWTGEPLTATPDRLISHRRLCSRAAVDSG